MSPDPDSPATRSSPTSRPPEYVARAIEEPLLRAAEQFPVLLLTGPRQVGKTTVLRHLREEGRRYATLDDPGLRALAREDPALFLQRFPPPVLIDEVQYAPELFSHIKIAVDEARRPGDFWLTGSQQFQMMQGLTESLAGRVAILRLLGFSRREAEGRSISVPPFLPTPENLEERSESAGQGDLRSLFRLIWRGAFPALLAGPVEDRDLFLGSYLQTYLQRDVRDLAQVGDQESFLRFVRACAARTAQMLNLSDLARDVDISVKTARSWLSILEASFQVFLLRPYESNVTKRLVKTPKLYFLDTGLAAYLTEWSSPETLASGAMAGAMLETFVLAEILKSYWHRLREPRLYYYRDRDRKEVDFLFVQDGNLYPVEVKLAASVKRRWGEGFEVLRRFPEALAAGAVLCLAPSSVPLDRRSSAVPIGWL